MADEENQPHSGSRPAQTSVRTPSIGLMKHLRGYFFAGVLITAPISLTFYFAWLFIHWVDEVVTPIIPERYNPETYLPFSVPGLGLIVVFVVLTLVGALTAGMLGRLWVRTSERALNRMPVIRGVYNAIKQILETVLAQKSQAFRSVVLFEYPRHGMWALGFITGKTEGEIQDLTEHEVLNVFLPTTPNPTSGFLLFVPKKDIVFLSMTVEEGIKMVVSGGLVTPPDNRPPDARGQVKIRSGEPGAAAVVQPQHSPEPERVE